MLTRLSKTFVTDQTGATAIEYGLIAALIALAIIVSANTVADNTNAMWTYVANEVNAVTGS